MVLISRVILFILVSFLISGCVGKEYVDYYKRENTAPKYKYQSGSLEGELITLPSIDELRKLISQIDRAKKRIWIETYIWTEKSTREAIIQAKNRGVDVRIILEPNVYNTPRINDQTIEILSEANIPVIFSSDKYTFTHMKMWIIDDVGCISTGNWSYTTFTKNREFSYCSRDISFLSSLIEIFDADAHGVRPLFTTGGMDSRIGLAPLNLRSWLENEIRSARESIIVYNQTISDKNLLELLEKKHREGISVALCQAPKEEANILTGTTLPLRESSGPYLHAKVILIDTGTILLGSANFTKNALDNNREIMIRISDNNAINNAITYIYDKDCKPQG